MRMVLLPKKNEAERKKNKTKAPTCVCGFVSRTLGWYAHVYYGVRMHPTSAK